MDSRHMMGDQHQNNMMSRYMKYRLDDMYGGIVGGGQQMYPRGQIHYGDSSFDDDEFQRIGRDVYGDNRSNMERRMRQQRAQMSPRRGSGSKYDGRGSSNNDEDTDGRFGGGGTAGSSSDGYHGGWAGGMDMEMEMGNGSGSADQEMQGICGQHSIAEGIGTSQDMSADTLSSRARGGNCNDITKDDFIHTIKLTPPSEISGD